MNSHTEKSEGTKCETTSTKHAKETRKKITKNINCKGKKKESWSITQQGKAIKPRH